MVFTIGGKRTYEKRLWLPKTLFSRTIKSLPSHFKCPGAKATSTNLVIVVATDLAVTTTRTQPLNRLKSKIASLTGTKSSSERSITFKITQSRKVLARDLSLSSPRMRVSLTMIWIRPEMTFKIESIKCLIFAKLNLLIVFRRTPFSRGSTPSQSRSLVSSPFLLPRTASSSCNK